MSTAKLKPPPEPVSKMQQSSRCVDESAALLKLAQGEFECNKYHGHGNYTFADGSFYTGPFEDNQMHGNGCFTDTQGVEWKGRFYNGTGPGLPGHATVLAR